MLHPCVIFLYFIGVFCFGFLYTNPVFQISLFCAVLGLNLYYNGLTKTLNTLKLCLLIGIFVLVINPLTNHRGTHILFYLLDNPITLEAVVYSVLSMLTISTLIITFAAFNTLINSERFLFLFSKVIPKTAFITGMSLRFSDLFRKRGQEIVEVQNTRGMSLQTGRITNRVQNAGKMLEGLVSWSLEDGMEVAQVLKAKNYSVRKRSTYTLYKLTGFHILCCVIQIVMLLAGIILWGTGAGSYNPFVRGSTWYYSADTWVMYILFIMFLSMPVVLDGAAYIKRIVVAVK